MQSSFGVLDQIIRSWAIVKKDMRIYYSKGQVILMGVLWPGFMFLSFAFGRQMPFETLMPGTHCGISFLYLLGHIANSLSHREPGEDTGKTCIVSGVCLDNPSWRYARLGAYRSGNLQHTDFTLLGGRHYVYPSLGYAGGSPPQFAMLFSDGAYLFLSRHQFTCSYSDVKHPG